jgi:hypothetical protein
MYFLFTATGSPSRHTVSVCPAYFGPADEEFAAGSLPPLSSFDPHAARLRTRAAAPAVIFQILIRYSPSGSARAGVRSGRSPGQGYTPAGRAGLN